MGRGVYRLKSPAVPSALGDDPRRAGLASGRFWTHRPRTSSSALTCDANFSEWLIRNCSRFRSRYPEFFDRFRRLNVRSNPELDALVDQARQVITGIEPQQLRDSVRLRQMVANDFTRIEQAVGDLLVDRPRRNILRRAGSGGAA